MKERNVFVHNTPLDEARQLWAAALERHGWLEAMPAEIVAVDDSRGRITAGAVYAAHSAPFYNAAAMDGIAVRFRDTIGARENSPVVLREGTEFVYVNTGNSVPEGFDAVIMIEDVHDRKDGTVEIIAPTTPWKHVRVVGEDVVATELILPEGHVIRPIDMGALLATGVAAVSVRRIPKVAVIPTGSELVQPGEPLTAGNIIEFNGRILKGYLEEWGVAADRFPIVPDEPERLRATIERAIRDYDIVVTNAGASAGTEDHTRRVLQELGEVVIHGVAIRPGKPVMLAVVNGKPVVGLPGYPVSAVLTLRLFVRDLVERRLGLAAHPPLTVEATLSRPLHSKAGAREFVRVKLGRVGGSLVATPAGRGAGAVVTLVRADGILSVPAGSEGIGSGERVTVELLRDEAEIDNTLVFIGSHDNILDVLTNLLHRCTPVIRLSSAHVGSMGGIMAIKRGEAHIAGTHLLDEETGAYNIPFLKRFLPGIPLRLINLVYRQQGFLVPKGNPKNITGFQDLVRQDVTFVNRQRGAGTRILTDIHLGRLGYAPEQVCGYEREEYTHMSVASAVASGTADTGLAIRAAATALDLGFIPVAEERYDIIVPREHEQDGKVDAVLKIICGSAEFRESVNSLGGYDLRDSGRVLYEQ